MSVDYYQKVYEGFNRHLNSTSENEIDSLNATSNSTSNIIPPSNQKFWWKLTILNLIRWEIYRMY